jgi:hypothetical protein
MITRTWWSSVPTFTDEREKKDQGTGHHLGNGRIRIALTAGACLFALVIVLKNILHVPENRLLRDSIVYIARYTGFSLVYPAALYERHSRNIKNPELWSVLIVVITLAIIIFYAL